MQKYATVLVIVRAPGKRKHGAEAIYAGSGRAAPVAGRAADLVAGLLGARSPMPPNDLPQRDRFGLTARYHARDVE